MATFLNYLCVLPKLQFKMLQSSILMVKILGLILMTSGITAAPFASVHVKFISPPHVYEHELTTDGGNTITQKSYLAIGRPRPAFGDRLSSFQSLPRVILPENAESLWPVGVFVGPVDVNDLGHSFKEAGYHRSPDFSDGLEYPDPFLLTGKAAMLAVRYLYGRGELFFHEIPHLRALLKNQEQRQRNGLHGNILSSLRPSSPFYRKANQ